MPRRSRMLLRLLPAIAILAAGGVLAVALSSASNTSRTAGRTATEAHSTTATRTVTVTLPHTSSASITSTLSASSRTTVAARQVRSSRSVARMLGQMIVARFSGPQPSPTFLARIRSGQIGGVILFADNVSAGVAATRALADELQRVAREGGNPPLLIMTDQEGGAVRHLPGPPDLAPSAMNSDDTAFNEGIATGRMLRAAGVNVDLAPVADVERVQGSFLGTRAFGSNPSVVARRACAFAQGLQSQTVAYTLKHFPGLGRATASTDNGPVSIDASAALIRDDYLPYVSCATGPLALVMVSSAIYPNLTGPLPAVMSPLTYERELRIVNPQAPPPTISDDLQAPALSDQVSAAQRAVDAGLDLVLYAQTEAASASAYQALMSDVRSGSISISRIRQASTAIEALKEALASQ